VVVGDGGRRGSMRDGWRSMAGAEAAASRRSSLVRSVRCVACVGSSSRPGEGEPRRATSSHEQPRGKQKACRSALGKNWRAYRGQRVPSTVCCLI